MKINFMAGAFKAQSAAVPTTWPVLIFLCLGFSLAQPASQASCSKLVDLTYCLAGPNQTLAYVAHTPQGFTTVLFADEAEVDGVKQHDFAGVLGEGTKVVFRSGVVLVMPTRVAEVFELQAELYAQMEIEESSQRVVVCPRVNPGDACEPGKLNFQPWSVGIRILRNKGSALGYSVRFLSREASHDAGYTLPTAPYTDSEPPGIWIVLSQQALARFYGKPGDLGNCKTSAQGEPCA